MPSHCFDFTGQRAVVTGAASGMGHAVATLARECGAEVTGLDIRNPEGVDRALDVDLRSPASVAAAAAAIDAPVDMVFNCAGLPMGLPPLDVMTVNFVGLRHLTELLIPKLAPRAAICSISSIALAWQESLPVVKELLAIDAFDEAVGWCRNKIDEGAIGDGYEFSKNCVTAYTAARCAELVRGGVRINAVGPGAVSTPMLKEFQRAVGEDTVKIPMSVIGRPSTPEEQAWPMLFLNSKYASYTTGTILYSDGGFSGAVATGSLSFMDMQRSTQ
jgi:NAD(P)-dependent dehydrogenase (short-subunit alcohol dehydrogenase family)